MCGQFIRSGHSTSHFFSNSCFIRPANHGLRCNRKREPENKQLVASLPRSRYVSRHALRDETQNGYEGDQLVASAGKLGILYDKNNMPTLRAIKYKQITPFDPSLFSRKNRFSLQQVSMIQFIYFPRNLCQIFICSQVGDFNLQ